MTGVVLSTSRSELEPCLVGDWGRGRVAGCFVALASLFAVVTKGDACFFSPPRRVQRWSSLAELLLPASSLTRNSRNSRRCSSLNNKKKKQKKERKRRRIFVVLAVVILRGYAGGTPPTTPDRHVPTGSAPRGRARVLLLSSIGRKLRFFRRFYSLFKMQ